MHDPWLKLVGSVLRPERPLFERCLGARGEHLATRRIESEQRARALAGCEARIESARAAVFASDDGVVPSRMTELEREWRRLAHSDPDAGLMDLWAQIAPPAWVDRKLWRWSPPEARLDAALALAADPVGVEAAEAALGSLRSALGAWGTDIAARIRWCSFEQDSNLCDELFAEPLRAAREALSARAKASLVVQRAQELEHRVAEAALARLPERPKLAQSVAHAAFVDALLRAASLEARPNPVTPLCALWTTGYVLSSLDPNFVTLEIPAL